MIAVRNIEHNEPESLPALSKSFTVTKFLERSLEK